MNESTSSNIKFLLTWLFVIFMGVALMVVAEVFEAKPEPHPPCTFKDVGDQPRPHGDGPIIRISCVAGRLLATATYKGNIALVELRNEY